MLLIRMLVTVFWNCTAELCRPIHRRLQGVFTGCAVRGSGVRFECVVSGDTSCAPGGKKKSRWDDYGFVRYVPSQAGNFNRLMPTEIFGHVPVGPFVRVILTEIFSSVTVDLLCCPAEDVSFCLFFSCFC